MNGTISNEISKGKRKVRTGIQRFSQKLMEEVVSETVGHEAISVVDYLRGKKNISEFQIAENIKFEVGFVRQMLYKLQNNNLVTYFRKKDRVKGWYISYWTFNPRGVSELAIALRKNKLVRLKERLANEEKNKGLFYICPRLCTRKTFEEATEIEFRCPECGNLLKNQNNERTIEKIKENIGILEKEAMIT